MASVGVRAVAPPTEGPDERARLAAVPVISREQAMAECDELVQRPVVTRAAKDRAAVLARQDLLGLLDSRPGNHDLIVAIGLATVVFRCSPSERPPRPDQRRPRGVR